MTELQYRVTAKDLNLLITDLSMYLGLTGTVVVLLILRISIAFPRSVD